jgi:L-cystine uptake protein TcyP (sodium:dicarboxylate symporter family)
MSIQLILNLAIALAVCALLYVMQRRHVSFTKRVFTGLGLGVVLGAAA